MNYRDCNYNPRTWLPPFVKIKDTKFFLRYIGNGCYYRDTGNVVLAIFDDNKKMMVFSPKNKELNGKYLIPIKEDEFDKYCPDSDKYYYDGDIHNKKIELIKEHKQKKGQKK